jgi:hypothetical protein
MSDARIYRATPKLTILAYITHLILWGLESPNIMLTKKETIARDAMTSHIVRLWSQKDLDFTLISVLSLQGILNKDAVSLGMKWEK